MIKTFLETFLVISTFKTVLVLAVFVVILIGIYILGKKGYDFSKRVIIGTVVGVVLGLFIQILAGFPEDPMQVKFVAESTKWLSLVGGGFIDLVRMLVIPLVFISIVHVILNIKQAANIKKLTITTIIITLSTVAIASIVGLVLGSLFSLGKNVVEVSGENKIREVSNIVDTFRNLIPKNPVEAMVNLNVIAIVVFAVFVGFIARQIIIYGESPLTTFVSLFNDLHKIMVWLADTILELMPYGVVALLASTLAQKGVQTIKDMAVFIGLIYLGSLIMFLVQSLILSLFGLNPITYFKKAKEALILAFTSRSSLGTLPVTIETLTNKMGVNDASANMVGSFGTTAGMQGCAGIFPALVIVYIANISNIPIDFPFFVMSIVVITLGSLGIAGIPGTATMAASVSLSGVGLGSHFASISPLLAVDPIVDMARTCLNVSGTMVNAIIVDKTLGTFDNDKWNSK